MLPPHRGSTPGLFRGVKEQAESKSQDRRCVMGRDKKQKMSHHETTCPALPQRPLAEPQGQVDCWHLLPWRQAGLGAGQ